MRKMTRDEEAEEKPVPWKNLPVSEPVLAGQYSREFHQELGWPIWFPAMITVVAEVYTSEAHTLLQNGAVTIDGEVAGDTFGYIKPGALVVVAGRGRYRIGPIEPPKY